MVPRRARSSFLTMARWGDARGRPRRSGWRSARSRGETGLQPPLPVLRGGGPTHLPDGPSSCLAKVQQRGQDDSGLPCISTPNICPKSPPGLSPAPARPEARVPTCPTCGPFCFSSWAADRLSLHGCRTPRQEPGPSGRCRHHWSPWVYFSHRQHAASWGGGLPQQWHPPFTPGTWRRAGGPTASSGGESGLGGVGRRAPQSCQQGWGGPAEPHRGASPPSSAAGLPPPQAHR